MSRAFRWTLIFLLSLLILLLAYKFGPKHIRHELEDAVSRLTAPRFSWPLAHVGPVEKSKLIQEYEHRDFNLRCYGALNDYEKIDPADDSICWAILNKAYDDIPARMVTFYFQKEKLSHLRLEFPESSAAAVQSYLLRALSEYPRVDKINPSAARDSDGYPLMVWQTATGLVMVQERVSPPFIVLWRHHPAPALLHE